MDNFQKKWMSDIFDALNESNIEMPDYKGKGKWTLDRFENPFELIEDNITYSASVYEFLNNKGLINTGYCPITGEKISNTFYYQLFGRKVFLSEKGLQFAEEYRKSYQLKKFGKELIPHPKKESDDSLNMFLFVGLIILIIFLIKGCIN
jgi:hypothetical protein